MTLAEFLAAAQAWLALLAVLLSVGNTVYTVMTARSKVNTERLDAMDGRLGSHAKRLATIENEIKHLPDKDMVTSLQLALVRLEGTVGQVDERVEGIAGIVGRIDKYLRKE